MLFTLTYDGPLTGSKTRARVKHEIRRALHPQIQAVWRSAPLNTRARVVGGLSGREGDGAFITYVDGHSFAAVVHDLYHLRARLRLLMLRRDSPGGSIIHGGDVDNRLKTLFDALQRPQRAQEIPDDWSPSADEEPLHCLLDDDRLVTRVDVDTARWLAPGDPAEVRLIINVDVWTPSPTMWSIGVIS
ncbi:hypothetical protein O7635_00095 [Asanoa sp. WMMD1127]|uniref:hypothetical protein n=1 Tax=Asanoa sp. WMMD1127 TaxID=3016107 RepID=UPI0024160926|nr:hypothetical protein [Asanoa sp. WMMD1127]MDG4820271.1 hypothetical protein [Asanoa sp. WMMD1127]